MLSSRKPSTGLCSASDFLLTALWWALLTGLGEGFLAPNYIWHDLMRAGVEIEPLLFLSLGLIVVAFKRGTPLTREELMRSTVLFSGLTVFACLTRSPLNPPPLLGLLSTVAAASLLALLWFLRPSSMVRWQKRSLPVLLLLAAWCILGFPIKQRRHEQRDLARLPSVAPGQPNVLLILVDTLRADHLSTYGYARPTSPHLTQLAAQGTLFQNAIAPSSWTLPVHASLLTGLYPDAHHVDSDTSLLGWHYRTLGEEFMARGYRTAAFSANTLLFCRRRGFGRGFIHFEDDFQSWGSSFAQTFYGDLIKHLLFRLELKADLFGRRSAAQINHHALRWIDSDRRPFFVFLNYFDVHDPYRPPEPYLHRYTSMKHPGSRASEHWNWFEHMTPAQRQGALDAYDGGINYVDDNIAELMRQLQKRGLDRNTVVVITSDHGESFGEHGLMTHGNALYRELIHVPLILWAPGEIPAGKKIAAPVSLTSLPATLLELAGEAHHPDFPEFSLAGLWNGTVTHPPVPPISEVAQLNWSPLFPDYYGAIQSITTAQWHYIQGGKFHQELFLCCNDEPEQRNLAGTVVGQEMALRFGRELAAATRRDNPGFGDVPERAGLGTTYHLDFQPARLALADFDSDGKMDIAIAGRSQSDVAVLLGDGKGGFQPAAHVHTLLAKFIAARMTQANATDRARCSTATNACAFALAEKNEGGNLAAAPLSARLADMDGDGFADLLLDDGSSHQTSWLRAEGNGRFVRMRTPAQPLRHTTGPALKLLRADLDGNGVPDLAFADKNTITFLLATSPGVFTQASFAMAEPATAMAFADLDHNGEADMVSINRQQQSVTVLLGL